MRKFLHKGSQAKTFQTVHEAYQFLQELGASPKLILHVKLVGEAADLLILKLHELLVEFDENFEEVFVTRHFSIASRPCSPANPYKVDEVAQLS